MPIDAPPVDTASARVASTSSRTPAGVALQASWALFLAYGAWAAFALPEHPPRPVVVELALTVVGMAMLAGAVGSFWRKRWALWLSVASCLPLAAFAVLCVLADSGFHWVFEVAVAVGVTGSALHPDTWRMHSR